MGSTEMILLDTQSLVWWAQEDSTRLSLPARQEITKAEKDNALAASAMSIWEVCLLVKSGRLHLKVSIEDWLDALVSLSEIQIVPVDGAIAKTSVFLPDPLHKDPADRIIIATAIREGATLVTSDKKILRYPHVQSVW